MTSNQFEPTPEIPDAQLVERADAALAAAGLDMKTQIFTSQDPAIQAGRGQLAVTVPPGFEKWQLPIYFQGPTFFFRTHAEPGAAVGEHCHPSDAIRRIVSGSIIFRGQVLRAGDWMFIPAGQMYEFVVGDEGAVMDWDGGATRD